MPRVKRPSKMAKQNSKKHFTKSELEKREKEEVVLPITELVPSVSLPEELHERFYWIVDQFKDYGILSNVDSDVLSMYVMTNDKYWEATKILNQMTILDVDYPLIQGIQDKFFKQSQMLAKELGLTMVSRSKLKREDAQAQKEPTDEERLFGDCL